MEITLAQKAISLALSGNWEEATEVNLQILKDSPDDVDALNRLARAYAELGKLPLAKETAKKVVTLDPLNPIALKCLEKWKTITSMQKSTSPTISVDSFLEESGKTKLIPLLNPGDSKVCGALDPGEEVKLSTHAHSVSIITKDGKYLGKLPDDISARLRNLIKTGYKYQVLIKSIEGKDVTVFIRETERPEDAKMSSFPTEKIDYVSFTPPELVHKEQPIQSDDLEEAETEIS